MKAEVDGRIVKLPDFLIVGAAKSGTTSLYHYLKQHPKIFMPDIKEPLFFAFNGKKPPFTYPQELEGVWNFNDYLNLFAQAEEDQLLGEASPLYLYRYEESIKNIKSHVPSWDNLKIVIILRNPVERAWSQYRSFVMMDFEPLNFEDALDKMQERLSNNWRPGFDYTGLGFYYNQVKAYMDNFQQVKICLFDDLKKDAQPLVREIFGFLGVDPAFTPEVAEKYNFTGRPKSWFLHKFLRKPDLISSIFPFVKVIPLETRVRLVNMVKTLNIDYRKKTEMKNETRQYLKGLYREDILKLQDLIGRDLSAWLE